MPFRYPRHSIRTNRDTVTFIDTPGFGDTDRSDVDTLNLITGYLQTVDSGQIRLSDIIYLHSIKDTDAGLIGEKYLNVLEFLWGRLFPQCHVVYYGMASGGAQGGQSTREPTERRREILGRHGEEWSSGGTSSNRK